jgi:hypothetical protein
MRFTVWYVRQRFIIGNHGALRGWRRLLGPHVRVTTGQASGECSVISMGGTKGGLPVSDDGIWGCLALRKLSSVECVTGPWRTEPHAPQHWVEHIEVDADDYPGGDPQNGQ